ncbi:hypothetical protein PR202_gb13737 [Eleusine coracana subsp. coracana]|uniref:Protein kinase domain-containing protein n=1 Tax=Eleusine coracana subsp. coracana TaxID=191504 RepID=A0AAV5ETX0_ELECO|nr:hypothetical protein PR202_gb13737 [Eleusine coracana subsp. coracana]
MRVFTIHSAICYSSSKNYLSDGGFNGTFAPPFLLSSTRNLFTVIGCNALGFLQGRPDWSYFTGCITYCESLDEAAQNNETCSGLGCCQTSLPANLNMMSVSWGNDTSNSAWSYNPCSYAFVADKDWYKFNRSDLNGTNFATRVAGRRTIPVVLDWAIRGNESCQKTSKGISTAPACISSNSTCVDVNATQGGGYRCKCTTGYEGNPYLNNGCNDINECLLREQDPDKYKVHILVAEIQYAIIYQRCPILDGDGRKKKKKKKNQQNIGGGEFVDEITFQFKLHHPNLVRLIGCCLETNVPCLVFEFISNGSLYNNLHGGVKSSCRLSLTKRLDIAIGSAEAISYMHSHGDHKHVHGDIKSANILLDSELMPKVSDFGSSKLLSIDMFAQAVAADRNYVDPVYVKTNRFTDKSDVYSFGIVLLELITRKTAMYDGNNSLPLDLVKCCKEEGNGRKMYDRDIITDDDNDGSAQVYIDCLDRIGALAVRCLKEDADERPTMAEVVEDLKQVKLRAWK